MYPLRRLTCAWTRVRLYAGGRPVVTPLLYPHPPGASSRDVLSVDLRGHVTTVSGLPRVPIRPPVSIRPRESFPLLVVGSSR
jgi:hypothetical protein